ncbi:UNKNOWN [Stylonychia lemnae]|uniref:Uncharacterized protein n=1 Tax=Stylonychia lemnae TaxID=5949 RepID=A0A078AE86_STYLE|nr:UNKNOWN [Stylonychia lemnae]|eukprot:CDW80505.1 UNKNOWN [Stylonychia lemnae]
MPDWLFRMPQKDRDDIMKSQMIKIEMNDIIKTLQRRDTKANIEHIQKEMRELQMASSKQSGVKNSISMYKIKQKMDQLERETKQENQKNPSLITTYQNTYEKNLFSPTSPQNQKIVRKSSLANQKLQDSFNNTQTKFFDPKQAGGKSSSEDGRMRYKLLTNFVNVYKEKMFLSNTTGAGFLSNAGADKDIMSIEQMKQHANAERTDITLDFEQFMRIYNFEKGRNQDGKAILSPIRKEQANTEDNNQSQKKIKQQGQYTLYKREAINYYRPSSKNNSTSKLQQNRPMSTYAKNICDQTRKLMKQTNEIRKNMQKGNKSFIEGAHKKQKDEQDDQEIKRQVDLIKQNIFSRGSPSKTIDYYALNRQTHTNSEVSPKSIANIRQQNKLHFDKSFNGYTIDNSPLQKPKGKIQRPKTGIAQNNNKFYQSNQDFSIKELRDNGTSQGSRVRQQSYTNTNPYLQNQKISMGHYNVVNQSNSNIKKQDITTQNAAALAQVYGDCISEMNSNQVIRGDLDYTKKHYIKDVKNFSENIMDISKNIKSEQIRYKRFNNYLRK